MSKPLQNTSDNDKTMPPSYEEPNDLDPMMSWATKEPESYKEIVLRQIEKCRVEGSKQMMGSGDFYTNNGGQWVKVQLLNQMDVYEQCVMGLYDLLEWYIDEEGQARIDTITTALNNSYETYFNKYLESEHIEHYQLMAKKSNQIIRGNLSNVGAVYLDRLEKYKYNLHRELYRALIALYKRQNELSKRKKVGAYD